MNIRRAIFALGAACALSFGLMLSPSKADAATLTINPRANAVEAGQILAAPTSSVFTITVYDLGLPNKSKTVTHPYQTGDTLRQTANKLVNKINADTDLQALGVTATLQNGANYTITSTSSNGTFYKQTTTGGGTNRLAVQETLTIGGTVTVGDKVTLTIYDAGLVGGKEVVAYKPVAGDTTATIVTKLRNKINNSTTLAPLDITAKVSSADANVLLIESPTFDATEKFTSYSAKVSAGATETVALGAFFGTNGVQTISAAGPITVGEIVKFTVINLDLPDSQKEVSYEVQAGDNLNKIRCGLRTEVNNDADLAEIGVRATCAGGVLSLTSNSVSATYAVIQGSLQLSICRTVTPAPWPGAVLKVCGNVSQQTVSTVFNTLSAIGNAAADPGGARAADAAQQLRSHNEITYYIYPHRAALLDSSDSPAFPTGGPPQALFDLLAVSQPFPGTPDINARGFTYVRGSGFAPFSVFYESYKLSLTPNTKIPYTVAHEVGHQLDAIYFGIHGGESLTRSYANGAAYSTSMGKDGTLMNEMPSCNFQASNGQRVEGDPPVQVGGDYASMDPVTGAPLGTGGLSGLFSGMTDSNGSDICSDRSPNYGGTNTEIIQSAFKGLNEDGFFQVIFNDLDPLLPAREMFAEQYAVLVGFPDTQDNSGATVVGHDLGFNTGGFLYGDLNPNPPIGDPSFPFGIYGCSGLHVYQLATHGELPPGSKTGISGYPVPDTIGSGPDAGMKGYGTTNKYCDGTSQYQGDYGFGS